MLVVLLPLLVAVVGLVVYFAANGKAVEVGRTMFACGLLVTLFVLARSVVRLP